MDLKQLKYFKTIVEEGSILAASKKLFMSQPPLSNQIKLLEEELSCVLFERGSRQITLTEEGKLLYERTKTLLTLSDITKSEINDLKNQNKGTIRIGIVSSISSLIISEYIKKFLNEYKEVKLEIIEANTYQLIEKLQSNLIDIAFVRTPFDKNDFKTKVIRKEKLVAIGNKEYFVNKNINIDNLNSFPIILYRRWYNVIKEYLDKHHKVLDYVCVNDDARTTIDFVNANVGVGIIPESASLYNKNENNLILNIEGLNISTDICLVYDENRYNSKITKRFIDIVTLF